MDELARLSCAATSRAIATGELRAQERVEAALRAIERADPEIGAFVHVCPERAVEAARRIDESAPLRQRPLAGVPVAIKDNIVIAGLPATAGSRILDGFVSPYTATAVERLEAAGAVVVGKTNLDEFGMGCSTERSTHGPTRNPLDRSRVAGGSSGGSAAAVAAGMVPAALGSDTGGSVRQPASFCGVVGLRPTYGSVSRNGLIAFASSLDQIGPLAAGCADARLLFEAISGPDPADATSRIERHGNGPSPDRVRIGVVDDWIEHPDVEPAVAAALRSVVDRLSADGCSVAHLRLPHQRLAVSAYAVLAAAEASSNLARYDGVRFGRRAAATELAEMYERTRSEGFGREVKRRILFGTWALSAGGHDRMTARARSVRRRLAAELDDALGQVDVLIGPTTPTRAFALGERADDPLALYASDPFTIAPALAGLPAISVPAPRAGELPVGVQLIGRAGSEAFLLSVAAWVA